MPVKSAQSIYHDILLAINIEGFNAYLWISDVYAGELSKGFQWCCIDSKFL